MRHPIRAVLGSIGLLPYARAYRHAYQRIREPSWQRRVRLDDAHLRQLFAWTLAENGNCIDVGAHVGLVLRDMLHYAPRGQHIAFEPLPQFYARLCESFPSVQVHRLAMANQTGESTFRYVRSLPGYSGLRERVYPGPQQVEIISVRVARLDDVLPAGYRPDLIKIDVEGGELDVLRGAIRTLSTYRPIVVFEHNAGAREYYGATADDVWGLLVNEVGLRIFDLDGNGPYDLTRFRDESSGPRWNFVARA